MKPECLMILGAVIGFFGMVLSALISAEFGLLVFAGGMLLGKGHGIWESQNA